MPISILRAPRISPLALCLTIYLSAVFAATLARADDASFDCKQAALVDEKIICSDSLLSRADFALNETYAALMESTQDRARQESVRADQHNWLLLRNRECDVTRQTKLTTDNKAHYVDCFLAAYEERAADLEVIKSHPERNPSEISTPIRKPQLSNDLPAAESDAKAIDTNIIVFGNPLLVWNTDGSLLVVAKTAVTATASLITMGADRKITPPLDTHVDLTDIQKLCLHGQDTVLIRKSNSDAEPMAAVVTKSAAPNSLSWNPLAPELAKVCHFDIHRQLVSSPDGHSFVDLGEKEDNDDRFVKLMKDGAMIPLTPPLRIDRRTSLQGAYVTGLNSFVVNTATDAPLTAEMLRRWAKSDCFPFWQVAVTTGSSSRTCIPYGTYVKTVPQPLETKSGLYVSAADSGLYRIDHANAVPVMTDTVATPTLSPDECTIGFAGPARSSGERHIELYNVCTKPNL